MTIHHLPLTAHAAKSAIDYEEYKDLGFDGALWTKFTYALRKITTFKENLKP